MGATFTPGPWRYFKQGDSTRFHITNRKIGTPGNHFEDFAQVDIAHESDARLMAAALELYSEAEVLRCLATSPRLQKMRVADALAELRANGCGHDEGAALAKARGEE
jgi:hypothetical protein